MSHGGSTFDRSDRAQALLEELAERRANDPSASLEELIAAHPALERELRELWAACEEVEIGFSEEAERARRARGELDRLLLEVAAPAGFSERYAIDAEIGQGGMGAVFRIVDKKLARPLAMKVMLGQAEAQPTGQTPPVSPRQLARFLNEARITSQLDHPGIVPVHEVGVDEAGRAYFTMRLVQGRTLAEVFERKAAGDAEWSTARVLGVIQRVCEALAFAHERGVIHRDLKPANVMVGDFGEVYVMDWGLARRLGAAEEPSEAAVAVDEELTDQATLTRTGHVLGTPSYMPPEQARGDIALMDPRSDVYAVGAMLYQLMAETPPYVSRGERPSGAELLARIANGPPEPLEPRGKPPELVAICEKAMRFDSHGRYANVRELAADLDRFLAGRAVQAFKTGAWVELRKWVQRNKALAASLAAALLAISGGATGYFASREVMTAGVETQRRERIERELETGYGHLFDDHFRARLPTRALDAFQRALELDPGNVEAIAGTSVALLVQRRDAEVVAFLDAHANATRAVPSLAALRRDALHATGSSLDERAAASYVTQPASASLDRFVEGWRLFMRARTDGFAAYSSAVEAFDDALFLSPHARSFHYAALTWAAEQAGDEARATRGASALIELWPGSATAWWQSGIAVARWDPDQGLRRLLRARELDPDTASLHVSLGAAYVLLGDGERALATFQRAIELDPRLAMAHANLGGLLAKLGRSDEAIDACRAAIDLDPELALAHYNLGRALSDAGRIEEAIDAYRRAVELLPIDPDARLNLGACLLDVGRLDAAVAELRRAVELQPQLVDAHYNLGDALQRSGEFEGAAQCFARVCEQTPEDGEAWFRLGECRLELGDLDDALEAARAARAKLMSDADPQLATAIDELIARCEGE